MFGTVIVTRVIVSICVEDLIDYNVFITIDSMNSISLYYLYVLLVQSLLRVSSVAESLSLENDFRTFESSRIARPLNL